MVSSSLDGCIRVWDCTLQSAVSQVLALEYRDGISAMDVPSGFGDSAVLTTGSTSGSLQVRDLRSPGGEGDKSIQAHSSTICSLCFDGAFGILSGDTSGRIELRDIRSMRTAPMLCFNGSRKITQQRTIQAVESNMEVRKKPHIHINEEIWEIAMGRKRKAEPMSIESTANQAAVFRIEEKAHAGRILSMGFVGPNRLCSLAQDKTLKEFCAISGELLEIYKMRDKPLASCAFDGNFVIGTRSSIHIM